MPPVTIGKNAQLAAFYKLADAFLQVRKISGRTFRPVGNALGQFRSLFGICFECIDHIYPIQGVQVVKMDYVVVHVERSKHQVAHNLGIGGDNDAECIFNRTYRSQ